MATTSMRGIANPGSPAFATSFEVDTRPASTGDEWQEEGDDPTQGRAILETQRIERNISLPAQQEKYATPGVPFVPPDPDLAPDDPQLQVIELDAQDDRSHPESVEHVPVKRNDPTADLTLRDLIFFVFDGFPSHMYRKRTANWIRVSDVVNNFMLLVVLVSCFGFSTESLPQYYDRDLESFNIIEDVCVSFFTFDILLRMILVRDNLKFVKSLQNWIDFVSIIPYYVALFVGSSHSSSALIMLRVLRLMRVFRIFKLTKRSLGLQAVIEAMLQSSEAISLLSFLLMIATVLFSSAMFFAEQTGASFDNNKQLWIRDDGSVSPFQSIFHTMWWCVVTMTTVGYGDDVPVTPLGKVVGSVTMLCGVFVLAFPTVILSTNFQEVHEAKVEKNKQLAKEPLELERELEEDEAEKMQDTANSSLAGVFATGSSPEAKPVEIDPRFAALIEKLQDNYSKFTRFPFKYNPYEERKHSNLRLSRERKAHSGDAPSPIQGAFAVQLDASPRVPVVSFNGNEVDSDKANSEAMEVSYSHAHRQRSQPQLGREDEEEVALSIADVERIVEGVIQIVDNEVAVFTPALYFEATETNHLYARVETVPGSEQELLTLHLVIDTSLCKAQVDKAIAKHRPDEFFISVHRAVKKIVLRLETENALLRDVRLITTQFDLPVGTVPITLLMPNHHVLSILLHNLSAVRFLAKCYYEDPVAVKEPLARYGGVLLTGDAFDDETELQLFVTEEDAKHKSKSELHGEEQTTAFGRRGSNYIVGSAMPAAATSVNGSPPSAAAMWSTRVNEQTMPSAAKRGATPIPPARGATPVPPPMHRGSTPLPVDGRSSEGSAEPSHGGMDLAVPNFAFGRAENDEDGAGLDVPLPMIAVDPTGHHIDLGHEFRHEQSSSAEPSVDEQPVEPSTTIPHA